MFKFPKTLSRHRRRRPAPLPKEGENFE